jgi:all-trans-retinol 13,14-reductase
MQLSGGMSYVISPSARDPMWNQRYPNKSTIIVLSEAGEGWVERAKHDEGFRRELEAKIHDGFFERAERHFPQLKGKTPSYVKVGTPVGCNVNAKDGASYGLEASPDRFVRFTHALRPKTKIEGLYLTGQDSASPGIAGAMFSARFTYAAVTGDIFHTLSKEQSPLKRLLPAKAASSSSGDFEKAA